MELTNQERKIYNLLQDGGCFSYLDICAKCYISSPRDVIHNMRNKGVNILFNYHHAANGNRFKKFFLGTE